MSLSSPKRALGCHVTTSTLYSWGLLMEDKFKKINNFENIATSNLLLVNFGIYYYKSNVT